MLAVEIEADLLLIDERKGRIVANRLEVNHIGLLEILIKAKREGLIPAVGLIMDDLKSKAGFWIGEDLYNYVSQAAGESGEGP